jgi:hypothetical protein
VILFGETIAQKIGDYSIPNAFAGEKFDRDSREHFSPKRIKTLFDVAALVGTSKRIRTGGYVHACFREGSLNPSGRMSSWGGTHHTRSVVLSILKLEETSVSILLHKARFGIVGIILPNDSSPAILLAGLLKHD